MAEQFRAKRAYNSTRRKAQARETQRQIIQAARALFIERGYGGTTIEAIAQEAGVAIETVYATFKNKRVLLSRVVDVAVVGDDEPVPLLERAGPQQVRRERDQHRQVRLFASGIREIMDRVAPMFAIMRTAAKTEPEIATLLRGLLQGRIHGMTFFVEALASNGPLRGDQSIEDAVQTTWAITSAEVQQLFTADLGWTGDRYEQWLGDTLTALLLPA